MLEPHAQKRKGVKQKREAIAKYRKNISAILAKESLANILLTRKAKLWE
jgi:hypothetical protein|tara:strand:+ start:239 stop:385 length:147 start_codon:yes stop_codon:yes gene_type:complete